MRVGLGHPGGGFAHAGSDRDGAGDDGSGSDGSGDDGTFRVGRGDGAEDGQRARGLVAFRGAGRPLPRAGWLGAGPAWPVITGTMHVPVGLVFFELGVEERVS